MKKSVLLLFAFVLVSTSVVFAQKKEPELSFAERLEADAKHNLDVAWQYFKRRKAYIAVLFRTEETIVAHPTFSKMDEILYLSGMSSYYLLIGKGKQKIDLEKMSESDREKFTPERLKEDAQAYLTQLVEEHTDSKYVKKAKSVLEILEEL